jgi:16S rRNA processing protein RimM
LGDPGDRGDGSSPPKGEGPGDRPAKEGGESRWLEVGRVAGPHGVRGKIRVTMYSGDAAGMAGVSRISLRGGNEREREGRGEFDVEAVQRAGGCAVFSLRGIDSPAAAAALRGARLSVRRSALPPLPEGEFYWEDAVGCAVTDDGGAFLGEVTAVVPGPAHDWLVVRRGGDEAYLPVVSAFLRSVDIAARRIVASPPPGW